MLEVIRGDHFVKARKSFRCNASEQLLESGLSPTEIGMTFTEKKAIVIAKRNKWKILPGEMYMSQTNKYEGTIYTWRAIPAIHEIMEKYNLYNDDY